MLMTEVQNERLQQVCDKTLNVDLYLLLFIVAGNRDGSVQSIFCMFISLTVSKFSGMSLNFFKGDHYFVRILVIDNLIDEFLHFKIQLLLSINFSIPYQ